MKVIICDVGNAASAFVVDRSGKTMMIDCGSGADKENPIDLFNRYNEWMGAKPYTAPNGYLYPLAQLHITHPDDDHVRNAAEVYSRMRPYLLTRVSYEKFPDGDKIDSDYVQQLDSQYRTDETVPIDWTFEINETCNNSVETCMNTPSLKSKVRNNSSVIRYIREDGYSILFCGDLEKAGWEVLLSSHPEFAQMLKKYGVNILIAPHHGHKSGFPNALFDLIGQVDVVIHSKDTEASKEGTDVSNQYTNCAKGVLYHKITDKEYFYIGKVLTTRSNGNIFIETYTGGYNIWTDKASSNHTKQKVVI